MRPAKLVTLLTIDVVRDTLSDCHFSAWSRPKPAPDPLPGPSVASGVIPTKGGRNGPVLATSGRASTGRWRSSPWKRCNHAPPRSGGQGAPRTARCIETFSAQRPASIHGGSGTVQHCCVVSRMRLVYGGGVPGCSWRGLGWFHAVLWVVCRLSVGPVRVRVAI